MAAPSFAPSPAATRRLSLAEIDAVVSARLGPTRGLGNSQPACFNRQIAMYLAKHIGGWTTTVIGRFYNGRDHSTVCYGIQRIEALREIDSDVDALITDLSRRLKRDSTDEQRSEPKLPDLKNVSETDLDRLAEIIAERVCALIGDRVSGAGGDA